MGLVIFVSEALGVGKRLGRKSRYWVHLLRNYRFSRIFYVPFFRYFGDQSYGRLW